MSRQLVKVVFPMLVTGLVLPHMAQALDSTSSLLVWWLMDEGRGTVARDHSGNGYDGTFVGEPQWVAGYGGRLVL